MSDKTKLYFKIFFIALIFILGMVIFLYGAGAIFLYRAKIDINILSYDTLYVYYTHYNTDTFVMKLLEEAMTISAMLALLVTMGLFFIVAMPKKRAIYGNSRLATIQEAKTAFKAPDDDFGVLCGKINNTYLQFGGTQHILMEAPSRSGKGVGFVVPNLLHYKGSCVVLDIKGENYELTSKYREEVLGQKVYVFNPAPNQKLNEKTGELEYLTHRWNFLTYVSEDENQRINDIQKIASELFPDSGDGKNDFFNQQARSLVLAIVLYIYDTPELSACPAEIYRQSLKLADKTYFTKSCTERQHSDKPVHHLAVASFNAFASLSDNTASSVMGTVTAKFEMWANPIIDSATSASDFDFRDIRKKPMTIYLVVTPDNISRFAFLINLFLSQCFEVNLRELPEQNKELKYPVLFLLDEFTAIGKIISISKGIAYFAGYKLRIAIIIQSVAQLISVYGESDKDTFVTNLALRIIFAPKENKIATEISESLGYITEKQVSRSRDKWGTRTGSNQSELKRAVFWPHELKEIGAEKQINLVDNVRPVLCEKIRYFKDKNFLSRLKGASQVSALEVYANTGNFEEAFLKTASPAGGLFEVLTEQVKVETSFDDFSNYDFSDIELGLELEAIGLEEEAQQLETIANKVESAKIDLANNNFSDIDLGIDLEALEKIQEEETNKILENLSAEKKEDIAKHIASSFFQNLEEEASKLLATLNAQE